MTTERTFLDIEETNLLGAWTLKTCADRATILDETFKLYVQDKPKGMPDFLWNKMCRKVLKMVIVK